MPGEIEVGSPGQRIKAREAAVLGTRVRRLKGSQEETVVNGDPTYFDTPGGVDSTSLVSCALMNGAMSIGHTVEGQCAFLIAKTLICTCFNTSAD